MDRTDEILARASQYLRAGTNRSASTLDSIRSAARSKAKADSAAKTAEDEVEAYLQSLASGGDKPKPASRPSASLPVAAAVPLSGRGRSFLKTRDLNNDIPKSTNNKVRQQGPETIEIALHSAKPPVQSASVSSSSYSSPSPPSSPRRKRAVIADIVRQSSDDYDEEASLDNRLVAERFREALKTTTGSLRVEENKSKVKPAVKENVDKKISALTRAPPIKDTAPVISTSFVDDSGNVIYSLTFEEDEDELKTDDEKTEEPKSDVEDVEEDESPVNMALVMQSVEELLSGPQLAAQETKSAIEIPRPSTANSMDSIAESITSRPESVASSIGSPKSVKSVEDENYSDDFDESSRSHSIDPPRLSIELPVPLGTRALQPNISSARTAEAQSIATTLNVAEESIAAAPLSESMASEADSTSRQRLHTYSSSQLLKLPVSRKPSAPTKLSTKAPTAARLASRTSEPSVDKSKPQLVPTMQFSEKPDLMNQNASFAATSFMSPQQGFVGAAPIIYMFPPQSFFAANPMLAPPSLPISSAPAEAKLLQHQVAQQQEQYQKKQQSPVVAQQSPSVYLPLFLERSATRNLIAQCHMLAESISATRIAYERRIADSSGLLKSTHLK